MGARRYRGSALDCDVPLHHQIYLQMRGQIVDGLWVGVDFPGEHALAAQFGVSLATSRKALDRLVAEGLIARGRGRRTQVVFSRSAVRAPPAASIEQRTFTYRVLFTGIDIAPSEACDAFGVPHGSRLWQCRRLRLFEGRPHSVTHNVQSVATGEMHASDQLEKRPMGEMLREAGHSISKMHRRIKIGFAPADVAHHLKLAMNDPTLVYVFTVVDTADAVIEWVRIHVRPDAEHAVETFDALTGRWTGPSP